MNRYTVYVSSEGGKAQLIQFHFKSFYQMKLWISFKEAKLFVSVSVCVGTLHVVSGSPQKLGFARVVRVPKTCPSTKCKCASNCDRLFTRFSHEQLGSHSTRNSWQLNQQNRRESDIATYVAARAQIPPLLKTALKITLYQNVLWLDAAFNIYTIQPHIWH